MTGQQCKRCGYMTADPCPFTTELAPGVSCRLPAGHAGMHMPERRRGQDRRVGVARRKPGERVRFHNGHAYVNGVITRDLGNGMVEVATSLKYTGIPALTYVYPYADVRLEAPR